MRISAPLKREIRKIAALEGIPAQDLLASFINSGIKNYRENGSLRSNSFDWAEFRRKLKIGDTVLANGLIGKIKRRDEEFCRLEISPGVVIEMLIEAITDRKVSKAKSSRKIRNSTR